jgi:hypothetical protein
MVNINLMGDEENREERQPDESFAQTVNLDLGETADDEQVSSFVTEQPPPSSYSREAMAAGGGYATRPLSMNTPKAGGGSSRNMVYLLVAALVLAALVAVYIMIPKSKTKDVTDSDITSAPIIPDSSALAINTTPPDTAGQMINSDPSLSTSSFDPLFASTRIGASTVSALARSFSGDNDFSLISYSGNNNSFLVQFTSPSKEAIAEAAQAMQRSASPQELRTVANLPDANGSAMNNVMMMGRVSERAAMMGAGGQRRMSFAEFSAWLKKLGADNGLSATLFEAGQPYSGEGGTRTPVQANFSGSRAGAFDFLNNLAEAGPNISLSKIILSSADRRAASSARLDVVLLFDFIE